MKRSVQGEYVTLSTSSERARAFIPAPLPPHPPIEWSLELRLKFDKAALGFGRLDAACELVPDAKLLVGLHIVKEAALSTGIEGSDVDLAELVLSLSMPEDSGFTEGIGDVRRLAAATYWVWNDLHDGSGLTVETLRSVHSRLTARLTDAGDAWRSGQRRLSVIHRGNASFIPPPVERIPDCMADFDRFLGDRPSPTPFLVKAALAHAQVELIQPFSSDNGRIARLLTTMVVRERSILSEPVLCQSFAFSRRSREYFEALNRVRNNGEWEEWLMFYADALAEAAEHSLSSIRRMSERIGDDTDSVIGLGRPAESALEILYAMVVQPVATSNWLVAKTGITPATVNKSLVHLEELGVVKEISNRKRNRIFCYTSLIEELCRETDIQVHGH
jgi:Fic family protein